MFTKDNFISLIAFIGACYFFAASVIIHLLQPDLDFVSSTLSYYALGRYGFILETGFIAIGVSQLLLAWLILSGFAERVMVVGAIFLLLAGIGVLMVAVFPVQPRDAALAARLPHAAGAIMQFLFFPVALLLLARKMMSGTMRNYSFLTGYFTAMMFLVLLILFVVQQYTEVPAFGLLEKIDILAITAWIIVAACNLCQPAYLVRLFGCYRQE